MKAILRQVRITPKKAQIVAGMIRGKKVSDALDFLKFTPKKAAKILYKVVASAAANAKNNFKQNFDHLYISEIYVTAGATYKRSMPVSRGRAHPILKRTAHIVVHLNVEIPSEKSEKKTRTKKKLLTANA